jgi:hypothetical protein
MFGRWKLCGEFLNLLFLLCSFCFNTFVFTHCLQVCERSLTSATGGPTGPPSSNFVRAEMKPSGFLIRPCDGGGSILHIVDHVDLDVSDNSNRFITLQFSLYNMIMTLFFRFCKAWSVPEVMRPLYESSKILAQKMTVAVSSNTFIQTVYDLNDLVCCNVS